MWPPHGWQSDTSMVFLSQDEDFHHSSIIALIPHQWCGSLFLQDHVKENLMPTLNGENSFAVFEPKTAIKLIRHFLIHLVKRVAKKILKTGQYLLSILDEIWNFIFFSRIVRQVSPGETEESSINNWCDKRNHHFPPW